MSEEATKTYVFGQDNNSLLSMLAPLCQQRGVDPNVLLAMKDKNSFGDGGFLWVIFLFFLMGWGGYGNRFGFGGRNGEGLANQINNDYGREDEECDDYEEGYKAGYKAAKRKYSHMIEDRY